SHPPGQVKAVGWGRGHASPRAVGTASQASRTGVRGDTLVLDSEVVRPGGRPCESPSPPASVRRHPRRTVGMLTRNSFPRPDDLTDKADPAVLYVRSYLLIRTLVGLLGILLPVLFIVGEAAYFRGGVHVRGSLSAYYHTSMRDIFVAGLCVIGFLLATYLSGQVRTWDFWLSLVAGVAVVDRKSVV